MLTNDILTDAYERIKEVVHSTVEGLSEEDLAARPTAEANSIAWLVWHLTRIQDDHIAAMADREQLWKQAWSAKFNLPFHENETGYGHSSDEVALVTASAELLAGYYDEVHQATLDFLKQLTESDYEKIVDTNWNPPVTLAVRLVSVLSDDLQHAGQAAYVRGMLKHAG